MWRTLPKQMVLLKSFCDVMPSPAVVSRPLITLPLGAFLAVGNESHDAWRRVFLPDGKEGWVRESVLAGHPDRTSCLPERELRQRLVRTAMRYCGTPYRWGGKTPMGIDCSGLVSMAYLLHGIVIWRDAAIKEGFSIHEISRDRMKPADLLYFSGHVAMYLGKGSYLHSTGKAGSDGVVVNSLDATAPDYREDLSRGLLAVGSYF